MSCFFCIFKGNRTSVQQAVLDEEIAGISVKQFSYEELRNATRDFSVSNKIGEGGFGCVYKGTLRDGTNIATKVLSTDSKQGGKEFLNEILTVYNIDHDNLVKLYGCCLENHHQILVYSYLVNNSLSQTLFGANRNNLQFCWKTKVKICIGVARGLAFLHEDVQPHIVHRDIKASNILLDRDLTPKISDFGLAKLLPQNTTHVSTRVAGTLGYLAPEYAIRGQVTRKSDVYSFGVLLLEIVSGRSNTNSRLPLEEQFLLERVWTLYEHGELSKIVDSSLSDDLDINEACMFLKVGLLCTQDIAKLRPTMPTVVKMLTGEREVALDKVTKPGLVSDLMELKIRSQDKGNHLNNSSSSSTGSSLVSTVVNSSATMSFTHISDRD